MNYVADYDRVIRYGRADTDAIQGFAEKGREGGGLDPHNNADAAFADYLEDANDPRHLIVRRDLSYRDVDSNFGNKVDAHLKSMRGNGGFNTFEAEHDFPDKGKFRVRSYHRFDDPGKTPLAHYVTWIIPTQHKNHHIFAAALAPDELQKILDEFGIEHIPKKS